MKSYLAALLLGTLAIGVAHAAQTTQTPPPPPPAADAPPRGMMGARAMERLDTDGDGRISRAEFAAASQERFQRMDANGDGFLDAGERMPRGGPNR